MAVAVDLIGNRYGKLIVISRAENNKKGNTMWNCVCDCGNEKKALGYDLTHGRTISCGCESKNRFKEKSYVAIDISNCRFGKLIAVEPDKSKQTKSCGRFWICKCDCGKQTSVSYNNLKNGHVKSCGCSKKKQYKKDITGERYERLVVVGPYEYDNKRCKEKWKCLCDCGNTKITYSDYLKTGRVKSCGCLLKENAKKPKTIKHNKCKTRIYKEWSSMLSRCKKTYHGNKHYYYKGIAVCEEWKDFEKFYEWSINNGYNNNLTLDRIDNDGNYEPTNCRWATIKQQANNKSTNIYIEYDDEVHTLKEWSELLGLNYGMLKQRYKRGWRNEKLFQPKIY